MNRQNHRVAALALLAGAAASAIFASSVMNEPNLGGPAGTMRGRMGSKLSRKRSPRYDRRGRKLLRQRVSR